MARTDLNLPQKMNGAIESSQQGNGEAISGSLGFVSRGAPRTGSSSPSPHRIQKADDWWSPLPEGNVSASRLLGSSRHTASKPVGFATLDLPPGADPPPTLGNGYGASSALAIEEAVSSALRAPLEFVGGYSSSTKPKALIDPYEFPAAKNDAMQTPLRTQGGNSWSRSPLLNWLGDATAESTLNRPQTPPASKDNANTLPSDEGSDRINKMLDVVNPTPKIVSGAPDAAKILASAPARSLLDRNARTSLVSSPVQQKITRNENGIIDPTVSVLTGYDHEEAQARLRYGDSISMIPNELNAVVAGTRHGEAWVQVLEIGVSVPPNLRDCQWRLLPPRQFVEQKKLMKLMKEGKWNEGRSDVNLPKVPSQLADLSKLSRDFCNLHSLNNKETRNIVQELHLVLKMLEEEREGNENDLNRQQGKEIRYGSAVMLEHVVSGLIMSVTKLQSTAEPGSQAVELTREPSDLSIFRLVPAFKVLSEGFPVTSGDFISLQTRLLNGDKYYIHMSENSQQDRANIDRKLALHHDLIKGIAEINASQNISCQPTYFRVLLFQPCELSDRQDLFKAEDLICFYHKDGESFLEFDPFGTHGDDNNEKAIAQRWNPFYLDSAPPPGFYSSRRLDKRSRKKSYWIWKVENEHMHLAGDKIVAGDNKFYRIKHVPSNLYLIQQGNALSCTNDYRDPSTLFCFRHFWKTADPSQVLVSDLIFLRSRDDAFLCLGGEYRSKRHKKAELVRCDITPDAHAITILPVQNSSVSPFIRLRRNVRVLQNFESQLQKIPEISPDQLPGGDQSVGPRTLTTNGEQVLKCIQEFDVEVNRTLRVLVLNCSIDEDARTQNEPLEKEGVPNRFVQKVLRELGVIPLVMHLLEDPFRRGLSENWLLKDERLDMLKTTMNLMYRLIMQLVRKDKVNSDILHVHMSVIRSHISKLRGGQVAICLKELFEGNRHLLLKIPQEGLIQQIISILSRTKASQYINFLASVCSCGSQSISVVQDLICDCLQREPDLLPTCRVERQNSKVVVMMRLSGTQESVDSEGKVAWICLNDFLGQVGNIIKSARHTLTPVQQDIRYYMRCLKLYGQLTRGRNQNALRFLIQERKLALSYEEVAMIMQEESVPSLVRAEYTILMLQLYLDRAPFSKKPLVHRTRVWSEVASEHFPSGKNAQSIGSSMDVAGCPDGFVSLMACMPPLISKLALNTSNLNFGELDFLSALVSLAHSMLDFGLWVDTEAWSTQVDYSKVNVLFDIIFHFLQEKETSAHRVKGSEGALFHVRSKALDFFQSMFALRTNLRITIATKGYENMFKQLYQSCDWQRLPGAKESTTLDRAQVFAGEQTKVLKAFLQPCLKDVPKIEAAMFEKHILSNTIEVDTYRHGKFRDDKLIQSMLYLCGRRDPEMSKRAISLVLRHMSQRSRTVNSIRSIQFLVFEGAFHVFRGTKEIIYRLHDLRKEVLMKNVMAYSESQKHIERLTEFLANEQTQEDVQMQNRLIMLNLEIHHLILNTYIFGLTLTRDTSGRDNGLQAMDKATDVHMRNLIQSCYNFLLELVRDTPKAQQACVSLFEIVKSHIGIEELNVVDTLQEILRDRLDLWMLVQDHICEEMVLAIKTWGRRSRWLSFLEVFCQVKGANVPAVKPFQARIFRLLLSDRELLLDLKCDYTQSVYLSHDDRRYGKSRLQLIKDQDYKEKYFSLVKYHVSSVNLLSLCCSGKNRVNQMMTSQLVSVREVLANILLIDKVPQGEKEEIVKDCDSLHYVKAAWARLLLTVYLESQEGTRQVRLVQLEDQLFYSDSQHGFMREIDCTFKLLANRLHHLPKSKIFNLSALSGKGDDKGGDLRTHIEYAQTCMSAADRLFTHVFTDKTCEGSNVLQQAKQEIARSALSLFNVAKEINFLKAFSRALFELMGSLAAVSTGIQNVEKISNTNTRQESSYPERTRRFQEGWDLLHTYLSEIWRVDCVDGRSSDYEIKDIAMMFGSRGVRHNEELQSLRQLMTLLSIKDQNDLTLVEAGLRVLRAILYLNPDELDPEAQAHEYTRCIRNEHATDTANMEPRFTDFQEQMARLGAINAVITCMSCTDKRVVTATLQLAVILVDGGNERVQKLFHQKLDTSSGQLFFEKLRELFDDAVVEVREMKRRMKRWARTVAELEKVGIGIEAREPTREIHESEHTSQQHMTEVMKMMRQMMIRNKNMQNLFRVQRFSRISFDFIIQTFNYVHALEPELKNACCYGPENDLAYGTVEVCIHAFLMLTVALQGPNRENQRSLASTGIFDLCDRINSHLPYESVSDAIDVGYAQDTDVVYAQDKQHKSKDVLIKQIARDIRRHQMKMSAITCLNSFFSGTLEDAEFAQQMLSTLNLWEIAKHLQDCEKMQRKGDDDEIFEFISRCTLKEGIAYCILLRRLMFFDTERSIVYPIILDPFVSKAWAFFNPRCGYVEIMRNNCIEGIHFPLPEGIENEDDIFPEMYETEREDVDKKNYEWLFIMTNLIERVELHAKIGKGIWAFSVKYFSLTMTFCLFWAACIHILCITGNYRASDEYQALQLEFAAEVPSTDNPLTKIDTGFDLTAQDTYFFQKVEDPMRWVVRVMCWINMCACTFRFASFVKAELPLVLRFGLKSRSEEGYEDIISLAEVEEVHDEESEPVYMQDDVQDWANERKEEVEEKSECGEDNILGDESEGWKASLWANATVFFSSVRTLYEALYFIFAALAVAYDEPLATTYSLFDICFWPGIRAVLDAFRFNASKMAETMLLGLLCMYVWMVIGMLAFNSEESTILDGLCANMFQCFVSFIFKTLRGDGVKEVMSEPGADFRFPTNIVDAFKGVEGRDALLGKMLWDISFQVCFLYILLSIITGIIIDGFGGLREARDASEEDLKTVCFVCSLDKTRLDLEGSGFKRHVRYEHNPEHYFKFLLYLFRQPKAEATLQDRHVKESVWPESGKRSVEWLPRETSISTLHKGQTDADSQVTGESDVEKNAKLSELGDQVEKLTQALESTRREHKIALEEIGNALRRIETAVSPSLGHA